MRNLRFFACAAAALGSMAVAGCSTEDNSGGPGRINVHNESDFAITEIHITSVGSTTWGPNLIAGDILAPGESLTVGVTCDTYDALLIDESGAKCTEGDINLCFTTADWVIRNDDCPLFGAARAAGEAAQAAGSGSTAH